MSKACPDEKATEVSSGFVLVELASVLAHSATLTAEIEEVISGHDDGTPPTAGERIMKLQKLDMVRQLQGDIANVLEEMSRSISNQPISSDELDQLIAESKLGVVRNALASCLLEDVSERQALADEQTAQDGGLDLF